MSYDSSDLFSGLSRSMSITYTGKILAEAACKDYPVLGKAMSVGVVAARRPDRHVEHHCQHPVLSRL